MSILNWPGTQTGSAGRWAATGHTADPCHAVPSRKLWVWAFIRNLDSLKSPVFTLQVVKSFWCGCFRLHCSEPPKPPLNHWALPACHRLWWTCHLYCIRPLQWPCKARLLYVGYRWGEGGSQGVKFTLLLGRKQIQIRGWVTAKQVLFSTRHPSDL